jgi:hypothetical protein
MASLPPPTDDSPQKTMFNTRTIVTDVTFPLLLRAVIETIQSTVNPKDVTWTQLVDNGFTSTAFANVTDISRILQCRNTIWNIMAALFQRFPVLKSAWVYDQHNANEVAVSKIMTPARVTRNHVYLTDSPLKTTTNDPSLLADGFQFPRKTFKPTSSTDRKPSAMSPSTNVNTFSTLDQDEKTNDDHGSNADQSDRDLSYSDTDRSPRRFSATSIVSHKQPPQKTSPTPALSQMNMIQKVRDYIRTG